MSKRKRNAKEREKVIIEKLCKLREERSELFRQNNCFTEAQTQAQGINNEISSLERKLIGVRNITGVDESKVYGKARVLISHGEEEAKEVMVIVKDHSIAESFATSNYIVSQESNLACAIRKTPINAIAEYGSNDMITTLRVIEKDF